MRKLMFEYALQFRVHGGYAAYRNAELAVIKCSRPRRSFGDVNEFFLRVKNNDDVLRRFITELVAEVLVLILHGRQQFLSELLRGFVSRVMEGKMPALLASRFLLDLQLAFGFVKQSLCVRVGREFHGSLPGEDCIAGAVGIIACQAQQAE